MTKVAAALLAGATSYCLAAIAQRMPAGGDLMICDSCGNRMSGYGFVARVTGADPCVCPECSRSALRPASIWDVVAFWR